MRNIFAIAGVLLTGACASDGAKMAERHPIFRTYESAEDERQVAACIQNKVKGSSVELADGKTIVSVKNQFGTSLIAWYVYKNETGSKIELRRAQSIAPGIARAEECFSR